MDNRKLFKAMEFAAVAHDGAYRKSCGLPYITHALETAMIASTITDDEDIIIAALFHDIVEDTEFSLYDISSKFGDRVAELVSFESEDKMKNVPPEKSWKTRKFIFLSHLKEAPYEAKIICLADKVSNMRKSAETYAEKGDDMWLVFNQKDKKEQEWYYRSIAENLKELQDTDAYKEYLELLDLVFPADVEQAAE